MPKSKKPKGYQDPLDSIYGAIFGSQKRKPVKTKPLRLTGLNASQELAKGLAEIASKPANYIATGTLGAVNDITAQQVNLMQFSYDQFDDKLYRNLDNSAGRYRIRGGDVASFMNNPNKFIDSAFKKADEERKWARYLNAGRGLDTALLSVWAKQQGLSSKESIQIGFAASNFLGPDQTLEARKKFAQNVVLDFFGSRGSISSSDSKYIPKEVGRSVVDAMEKLKGLDIKSEAELKGLLGGVDGLASRSDFNDIVSEIYKNYRIKRFDGVKEGEKTKLPDWYGGWMTEGKLNRDGYISVTKENLYQRARLLDLTDPKQKEEYLRMMKAYNAMDVVHRIKGGGFGGPENWGNVSKSLERIQKDISSETDPSRKKILESLYNQLNREAVVAQRKADKDSRKIFGNPISGNFSTYKNALMAETDYLIQKEKWKLDSETDPAKKVSIQTQLDLLISRRKNFQTMSGMDWRIFISDVVGTYRAIDGNILQGGIGAGLITGGFYTSDNGFMGPGSGTKVSFYKNGKEEWANKILLPRDDISSTYSQLAGLYYLTPGSLVKTAFFNGEGLGYLVYLKRLRDARVLNRGGVSNELYKILVASEKDELKNLKSFFKDVGDGIYHMDERSLALQFPEFFEQIAKNKGDLTGVWDKLDKIYRNDQRGALMQTLKLLGTPSRLFSQLQNEYNKKVKARVNEFLVKKVFARILGSEMTTKLLSQGLAQIGFRQMISAVVNEVLASVGATIGGPLGAVIAAIATFIAEGFIDRIIRPFIQLFLALLWAIILVLFAVIGYFVIFMWSAIHPQPQQHIPPTDAIECAAENPYQDLYINDYIPGGDYGEAPAGSSCPIQGSLTCTQGDGAGSSSYHQQRHSMDIGTASLSNPVWYAPTDGTVTMYSAHNMCSDGKDYGGIVEFTDKSGIKYILLHVQALATGAVKKGKPVAIAQTNLQQSYCWTGPHFHLDVVSKGTFVDTQKWYKEQLKCSISSCPLD